VARGRARIDAVHASGDLAVGPDARELASVLLRPALARAVPPVGWVHRLLTDGLLPPAVRDAYHVGWTPARNRQFDRVTSTIRRVRQRTPGALARWPAARATP
jgi:uncharacterized protein (DUF2236 family)